MGLERRHEGRCMLGFYLHFRVGNLGQTATHTILLAQLVTPDGVSRGLHSFIVPIRDRETLRTFPGVVAGDMGAKASGNICKVAFKNLLIAINTNRFGNAL